MNHQLLPIVKSDASCTICRIPLFVLRKPPRRFSLALRSPSDAHPNSICSAPTCRQRCLLAKRARLNASGTTTKRKRRGSRRRSLGLSLKKLRRRDWLSFSRKLHWKRWRWELPPCTADAPYVRKSFPVRLVESLSCWTVTITRRNSQSTAAT